MTTTDKDKDLSVQTLGLRISAASNGYVIVRQTPLGPTVYIANDERELGNLVRKYAPQTISPEDALIRFAPDAPPPPEPEDSIKLDGVIGRGMEHVGDFLGIDLKPYAPVFTQALRDGAKARIEGVATSVMARLVGQLVKDEPATPPVSPDLAGAST